MTAPILRAVLDANVFISALIRPEGPPGQVIRRFLDDGAFELVTSSAILEELRRTLRYPRVLRYLRATPEELEVWVHAVAILAHVVPGNLAIKAVEADPDDDIYLAAAVEGLAKYMVSGDGHLLGLRQYGDIRILPPREFLDLLA